MLFHVLKVSKNSLIMRGEIFLFDRKILFEFPVKQK